MSDLPAPGEPIIEVRGLRKVLATRRPRWPRPRHPSGRDAGRDGWIRLRQEHLPAHAHRVVSPDRGDDHAPRAPDRPARRGGAERGSTPVRHPVPVRRPLPVDDARPERGPATRGAHRPRPDHHRHPGEDQARARRSSRACRQAAGTDLRRHEEASGPRPGTGPRSGDPLLRRTLRRTRSGDQRGDRPADRRSHPEARRDERRGDPRDGLGVHHRRSNGDARQGPRPPHRDEGGVRRASVGSRGRRREPLAGRPVDPPVPAR